MKILSIIELITFTELSSGLHMVNKTRKETILNISAKLISNTETGTGCLGPSVSVFPPIFLRLVLIDDLLDDVLWGRVSTQTCPANDVVPAAQEWSEAGAEGEGEWLCWCYLP